LKEEKSKLMEFKVLFALKILQGLTSQNRSYMIESSQWNELQMLVGASLCNLCMSAYPQGIDYCSLIGRKNLDVNKVVAQEDRPSAFTHYLKRRVKRQHKFSFLV